MTCAMNTVTSFGDWLQGVLNERKMKPADLANMAHLGSGTLSDIISGRRNVGTEVATSIADALDLPQEEVFRAAGILRPKKAKSQRIDQIVHILEGMTEDEQQEYLSYIRWRHNQTKQK